MKGSGIVIRAAVLACCGSILSCVGVQAEDVFWMSPPIIWIFAINWK